MGHARGRGAAGRRIIERCDELAGLSEQPDCLTRTFGSAMHRRALERIGAWMEAAGMHVREDTAGNLIGRYEGDSAEAPAVMMGSHQDTVRNGGRFDGMLGIIAPIEAVARLEEAGRRLPFAIEIAAFTDEEGVRFGTTLLGSRALAGTFDPTLLAVTDRDGITLEQAMRDFGAAPERIPEAACDPARVLAFIETHIEQGPRLEQADSPVGVVTAIAGGTRLEFALSGRAGHAGTVPMDQRRDALAGAAEAIVEIERYCREDGGIVGTVGRISASPGAINVIPGEAVLSADIRAPDNDQRRQAVTDLRERVQAIARERQLEHAARTLYEVDGCPCDPAIVAGLEAAARKVGLEAPRMYSGAGHDTMAMAAVVPVGMLFVRCRGGISHHPDESVAPADADAAARVLHAFLETLSDRTSR